MSAINRPLAEFAAREVVGIQRGFIRGRPGTCNEYELSAAADAWATWSSGIPGWMLLDIAAAFPSLAMDWLWELFVAMQLPGPTARALRVMY